MSPDFSKRKLLQSHGKIERLNCGDTDGMLRERWPMDLRIALRDCKRTKRGITLVTWLNGKGIAVPAWHLETPIMGLIDRNAMETQLNAMKTGLA